MFFLDSIRTLLFEAVHRFFLGQPMFETRMEFGQRLLDRPGLSRYLRTIGRLSLGRVRISPFSLRRICLGRICGDGGLGLLPVLERTAESAMVRLEYFVSTLANLLHARSIGFGDTRRGPVWRDLT
jgi:hypothetical protein